MTHNTAVALPQPPLPGRKTDVIVLFAGDSGETMQLAGKRFTRRLARGNGAEPITTHAPLGNQAPGGPPAFQVAFGDAEIRADVSADILVAFDAAALHGHSSALARDGLLLVNAAAHATVARVSGVRDRRVVAVDFDGLTLGAVGEVALSEPETARCRNFTALGVVSALLGCASEGIRCRTTNTSPAVVRANRRALRAGYGRGEVLRLVSGHEPDSPTAATRYAA